jgi:hypothetical protein
MPCSVALRRSRTVPGQCLLNKVWAGADRFTVLMEQLPDDRLHTDMADPKYGTRYRNLHGIIEHAHYHMGYIVIQKKMPREGMCLVKGC